MKRNSNRLITIWKCWCHWLNRWNSCMESYRCERHSRRAMRCCRSRSHRKMASWAHTRWHRQTWRLPQCLSWRNPLFCRRTLWEVRSHNMDRSVTPATLKYPWRLTKSRGLPKLEFVEHPGHGWPPQGGCHIAQSTEGQTFFHNSCVSHGRLRALQYSVQTIDSWQFPSNWCTSEPDTCRLEKSSLVWDTSNFEQSEAAEFTGGEFFPTQRPSLDMHK